MQLSKLYSNDKRFKSITFKLNGLNVIYADVKTDLSEKKNSHDLGKTKLSELIDFMLLDKINKNHFLLKIQNNGKSIFSDYTFYLEIYLNSENFLTIKRSIENNTKISFKLNHQTVDNYIPPLAWDYEDIPIDRARSILADYLSFDFFHNKDYNYRKSLNYSIRSQNDFKDVYKLDKFRGADIHWKPFMFDLLGFEGNLLKLKYENDKEIEDIKTLIRSYQTDYSVRVDQRDELIAEKTVVEREYKEIEDQIDKFNFYKEDKKLINKGISELENNISNLNSIAYKLKYELDRLRKSIQNNFSFDLEKVEKIFEETSIYFSEHIVSDYENLLRFNQKLTFERNKLLKSTIKHKEKELESIYTDLKTLNKDRESLLVHLTDTNTFTKFKESQKNLVKVEGRILKFQEKIKAIDLIIEKEQTIQTLQEDIKSTITRITHIFQTTGDNKRYNKIRELFTLFYKHIMDEKAFLSWKINSSNNVDFVQPIVRAKDDNTKNTAKSDGNTYMKLLCVSFDLSIICSYNKESYYRFIYHDDVLSQQDNGIKTRLLELINRLIKENKLQYIISVIKSDLPVDNDDQIIYFDVDDIILELHDKDNSGRLFGFEF